MVCGGCRECRLVDHVVVLLNELKDGSFLKLNSIPSFRWRAYLITDGTRY